MIIDLFIAAEWFTVPLKGKLVRQTNGKKTNPVFPKDWKDYYASNFNESRVRLAGSLTGKCSGIIAIDCDNDVTYNIFKSFDPEYKFHFVSKGKPTGGGTIIYKYTDSVGQFSLNDDDTNIKLDFYSDGGFVYLPTEGNKTKGSWEDIEGLPELKEAPPEIIAILRTFKMKVPVNNLTDISRKTVISNRLAPLVDNFVNRKGAYDPSLFKILTPHSFRDLPKYIKQGHIHPTDIPKGRGSEYLMKISAILGADISISIELYTNTIMYINNLWEGVDRPKPIGKLNSTIINPMIEGNSSVEGEQIWSYDEHWDLMGFVATSINGDYIESFFDDIKGLYYLVNYSAPYVKTFSDKTAIIKTLKTLLGRPLTEGVYDTTKQLVRTNVNPALEFGHIEGTDQFNMFRQSEELNIINNPAPYSTHYTRPTTIIKYFETLVPDDKMRHYLLSFLKTKLTTFKYSPVILYLIGKPGSGKDTLVTILGQIIGSNYVIRPETKVFLEQYNGWIMDKYVIHLDEYGNKLTRSNEKQEALGKLKAYTGSERLNIRAMRQDSFDINHSMTFIITANKNPLPVETDDRRVAFIKTPNKLRDADWVNEMGGMAVVYDKIMEEVRDFAYYLATEIDLLDMDSYGIPPETEDREELILDNLPAAEQITYYINHGRFESLRRLAYDYAVEGFETWWDNNRLREDMLETLYEQMTDGAGSIRTVTRMLKSIGIKRDHTTSNKSNVFYYYIEGLNKVDLGTNEAGFSPIKENTEGKETKIKGLS